MPTTRSYTVPYVNGNLITSTDKQAIVRLTDNKIAWVWMQTNPNWTHVTIMDVAGGIMNGGAPTIVSQKMFEGITNNIAEAVRLNDTTFVVLTNTGTGDANFSYRVFEVDAQNNVTLVDNGSIGAGGGLRFSTGSMIRYSTLKNIQDNKILIFGWSNTSNWGIGSNLFTWNPTTKKLSSGTFTAHKNNIGSSPSLETFIRPIPGRNMFFCSARGHSNGFVQVSYDYIFNADGTLFDDLTSKSFAYTASGIIPLDGDRFAQLNSTGATFWDYNYTTKTNAVASSGVYGPAYDDSTKPFLAYGLNKDYVLMISRNSFYNMGANPDPFRFRVVRKLDRNTVETSAGSILNNRQGFPMTNLPTLKMLPQWDQLPELIGNKLFYWAFDNAGVPGWVIITLPST